MRFLCKCLRGVFGGFGCGASFVCWKWCDYKVHCQERMVDVRLPGKGNSNSHGARPVHLIITMI